MLETLRDYAAEQLAPEEQAALRRRHAELLPGAGRAGGAAVHGPEQSVWLDRLEADHDNFRAALSWGLESPTPAPCRRPNRNADGVPTPSKEYRRCGWRSAALLLERARSCRGRAGGGAS